MSACLRVDMCILAQIFVGVCMGTNWLNHTTKTNNSGMKALSVFSNVVPEVGRDKLA